MPLEDQSLETTNPCEALEAVDESKFLQAKDHYDLNDIHPYYVNNLQACVNSKRFATLLKKHNLPYEHLCQPQKPNEPFDVNRMFNNSQLYKYFFDYDELFQCLEPIWSVFLNRFNELFYHETFKLGDPSKPLAEQHEIILLDQVKYVRHGGVIKVYVRNEDEWKHLEQLENGFACYTDLHFTLQGDLTHLQKGKDSRLNFVIMVAHAALRDVFHLPVHDCTQDFSLQPSGQMLRDILHLFTNRLTRNWYYQNKDQPAPQRFSRYYISKESLTERFQAVNAVFAHLLDKEITDTYLKVQCTEKQQVEINLSYYNYMTCQYGSSIDALNYWYSDNPIKAYYLFNLALSQGAEVLRSYDSFAYENILYKNNPYKAFPFYDKRAYHGFLKHGSRKMLNKIIELSRDVFTDSDQVKKVFMMITYWMGYTKLPHLNDDVVSMMIEYNKQMHLQSASFHFEEWLAYLRKSVHALDLLHEKLLQVWQESATENDFKINLRTPLISEINDFINHTVSGFPVNLNRIGSKATTKSLERLARTWHEEILQSAFKGENKDFPHLLPYSTTIGESSFSLIHNQYDLFIEAKTMHHCILTYQDRISEGNYLAFQVQRQHERATLGIWVRQSNATSESVYRLDQCLWVRQSNATGESVYRLDQCYSYCNNEVSAELFADCERLITALNERNIVVEKKFKAA